MKDLTKAFEPFAWNAGLVKAEEDYKEAVANVAATYLGTDTEIGAERLDTLLECWTNRTTFSVEMVELLKEHRADIYTMVDTSWLLGYLTVDVVSGSVKYYFNSRMMKELKGETPKTAEEVINFMLDRFGFIPVMYNMDTLSALADDRSHTYGTIKNVMEKSDNWDVWSDEIKTGIESAIKNLAYEPKEYKYYFIKKGTHGWYLKADKEKNEVIKAKREAKKKREEDETKSETAEAVETKATEVTETTAE